MPKSIKIGPNDLYRLPPDATPEQKAAWKAIKEERPRVVPYVTAMENIQNSGNMYRTIIEPDEGEMLVPGPRRLEDYSIEELKVMLVSLGIKTAKQMRRADIVDLVRRKLDEIEVADEGDDA